MDIKYMILQKLVKIFGLEKVEKIWRMFERRKA